jgi:uncharacterized membrane protein YidH (DUF202 family)
MAQTVRIRDTPATAKTRHPVGVFALVLVTLGIYYLVWYYKVNRELRDLGRATGEPERLGTSPLTSLLAVTIGWLVVVPPFVSWYRTFRRIRAAQEVSGVDQHVSVALGFVLYVVGVFILPIEVVYAQDELNRVWRAETARGAGAP